MRTSTRVVGIAIAFALSGCASSAASFSNPTGAPMGPYSQVAEARGFIFVSGVLAIDPATHQFSAPNIEDQTRQALANLDALLLSQGLTRSDVVRTTVYLRDPADMGAMNVVYADYFGAHRPARTTVPGADWGNPNILIEIEAIAVRR